MSKEKKISEMENKKEPVAQYEYQEKIVLEEEK